MAQTLVPLLITVQAIILLFIFKNLHSVAQIINMLPLPTALWLIACTLVV